MITGTVDKVSLFRFSISQSQTNNYESYGSARSLLLKKKESDLNYLVLTGGEGSDKY